MKKLLIMTSIATLSLSLLLTGCSGKKDEAKPVPSTATTTQQTAPAPAPKEPEKLDAGNFTNRTYTNKYFGLTLQLPNGWVIPTNEEMADLRKKGQELVAGNDENLKKMMDISEMNTAQLVTTFKYPQGTPGKLNPSFTLLAEKAPSGIKSGEDILTIIKDTLGKAQIKYNTTKPFYTEKIAGTNFNVLEATLEVNGIKVTQKYYASLKKSYILEMVTTTFDKSPKKDTSEVHQIIASMTMSQ